MDYRELDRHNLRKDRRSLSRQLPISMYVQCVHQIDTECQGYVRQSVVITLRIYITDFVPIYENDIVQLPEIFLP